MSSVVSTALIPSKREKNTLDAVRVFIERKSEKECRKLLAEKKKKDLFSREQFKIFGLFLLLGNRNGT